MNDTKVINRRGYRLKTDSRSYVTDTYGLFDKQLDEKYECVLQQLTFEVDNLDTYEAICYQRGKLDKLDGVILNMLDHLYDRKDDRMRTGTTGIGKKPYGVTLQKEINYLHELKTLVGRKRNQVFELYNSIFDIEYDVLEKQLMSMNEKADELDDTKVNEEVEKSNSIISELLNFFK